MPFQLNIINNAEIMRIQSDLLHEERPFPYQGKRLFVEE
jgi:hypothetical protein